MPLLLRFIVMQGYKTNSTYTQKHNKQYKTQHSPTFMSEKEKRIKLIVKLYYSNPRVQEAIFSFAKDREVIPRYIMESFGKRPDTLQYPSDIINLVNKGATSFHCSEELWNDPLNISSEMT